MDGLRHRLQAAEQVQRSCVLPDHALCLTACRTDRSLQEPSLLVQRTAFTLLIQSSFQAATAIVMDHLTSSDLDRGLALLKARL